MIAPHARIMHPKELTLLMGGIDVAISSLNRFERPLRPRRRWSAEGRVASSALARSMLRSRGGMLTTRFVGGPDGLRVEIIGADSGVTSPLLTIRERTPRDRNPTHPDAEEIEATMRRWLRIADASVVLDVDAYRDADADLGAMLIASGADVHVIQGLQVRLPSRYEAGFHLATENDVARNGPDPYRRIESIMEDERDRIMENHTTSIITSQWWNYGNRRHQQRVLFDLSGVVNATIQAPDPIAIMRRLAA